MPDALWAGILAGYAIAVPVGPIAILIFETGLRRGIRIGAAAGAGAASADGFYATVAGLVGAAVAGLVAPVITPARIVGAALLAFIGVRGLVAALTVARHERAAGTSPDPGPRGRAGGALRTYLLFLGLTIMNPLTFLYFGALMLGLPAATGSEGRVSFAAGAFGASLELAAPPRDGRCASPRPSPGPPQVSDKGDRVCDHPGVRGPPAALGLEPPKTG